MLAPMSSAFTIRPRSTGIAVVSTCPDCRRRGTLQLVRHPAGDVLVCRRCLGAHRQTAAVPGGCDEVDRSQRQQLPDQPS
jgi:Zn ribbon nucleic-acid-binding protein